MWVELFRFMGDGEIPGASTYTLEGRRELDGTYVYRVRRDSDIEIMRMPERAAHVRIDAQQREVTNV